MDAAEPGMANTPYVKRDKAWTGRREACSGSPTSASEVVEFPRPPIECYRKETFVQFLGRMVRSNGECRATAGWDAAPHCRTVS
jgi:hypothetical protein